ncbi:hypothetical protein J6590_058256 [Homalodisca vitripennis]|nr:hypothetical protein J6590_058256 [Homalodisca vitripennis]
MPIRDGNADMGLLSDVIYWNRLIIIVSIYNGKQTLCLPSINNKEVEVVETENKPQTIFYKYSNNEDVPFYSVNVKKRATREVETLDLLYPKGKKIEENKKKRSTKHEFYNQILSCQSIPETIPVDDESNNLSEEDNA